MKNTIDIILLEIIICSFSITIDEYLTEDFKNSFIPGKYRWNFQNDSCRDENCDKLANE